MLGKLYIYNINKQNMNVLERFFEMINSHTFVRLLNTKFKKCNTEFSTIESSFFTIAVEDLVVVDIPDDP